MVAPYVLSDLSWLAWTSLGFTILASVCWYLSRRWHVAGVVAPLTGPWKAG
jgi:hypothetical protein